MNKFSKNNQMKKFLRNPKKRRKNNKLKQKQKQTMQKSPFNNRFQINHHMFNNHNSKTHMDF